MSTPARPSIASPRQSTDSSSSSPYSPIAAHDSSSHLILVQDDSDTYPLNFDEQDSYESDEEDAAFEPQNSGVVSLTPSSAFLYLLAPYLRMGAMYIPQDGLPLKISIPALAFFAVLSAFTRQIWYLLARYIHKADMESVILDAFARGRGKEGRRAVLRGAIRLGTGALSVMLAVAYLRDSVDTALPFLPPKTVLGFGAQIPLTVVLVAILFPLCMAQSMASRRTTYSTWTSLVAYVAWLCTVGFAHAKGLNIGAPTHTGVLWKGVASIAFAFTTSSTLPLYASLKVAALHQSLSTKKTSRSRSFRSTSLLSVAVAAAFIFPLCFFSPITEAAYPEMDAAVRPIIAAFRSLALLAGIPATIVTAPALPIPGRLRESIHFSLSKVLILGLVLGLSCVQGVVVSVLSDMVLVSALGGTYFLPALVHIITHQLKRPLSIVIPPTPVPGASTPVESSSPMDELLQRKEVALQKRQFRKRIVWDVGVWVLLAPVSGGGVVWSVGRVAGAW